MHVMGKQKCFGHDESIYILGFMLILYFEQVEWEWEWEDLTK